MAGARFTELPIVTEAKGVDGLSEQWSESRFSQLQTYNQQTMYVAEYHVTKVEHHN